MEIKKYAFDKLLQLVFILFLHAIGSIVIIILFNTLGSDNNALKQAATIEEAIAIVSSILMLIKVHKKVYPRFRGLIIATAVCGIVAPPANLILSLLLIRKIYLTKTRTLSATPPMNDDIDASVPDDIDASVPDDIDADTTTLNWNQI